MGTGPASIRTAGGGFGDWTSDSTWWTSQPAWFRRAYAARSDADAKGIQDAIAFGAATRSADVTALLVVANAILYRDLVDADTYRRELHTLEQTGSAHLLALWHGAQCAARVRHDDLGTARDELMSAVRHAEQARDVFVDIIVGNAYGDFHVFVDDPVAAEEGFRLAARSSDIVGGAATRVLYATNIAMLRLLDGDLAAAKALVDGIADDARQCPRRVVDLYDWAQRMCGHHASDHTGFDREDLRRLLVSMVIRSDSDLRATPASDVAQLLRHARLDPVTRLPPESVLRAALEPMCRSMGAVSVLLLRVLEFARVEIAVREPDRSAAERTIAARVVDAVGPRGMVGRRQFDEFAVIVHSPDDVEDVVAAIEAQVAMPIEVSGLTFSFKTRSAVATSTPGESSESVFAQAAATLGTIDAGAAFSTTLVADQSAELQALDTLTLISELCRAVDEHDLRVEFQPVVDALTGRMIGAEALARWTSPRLGPMAPARFIPVLETSGLIVPASRQLIRHALAEFRRIHSLDPSVLLGINVSATEFQHDDLPDFLDRACDEFGFRRHLLRLEITESALVDLDHEAGHVLGELRRRGYHLVLDDFGTGHSNLSYLVALPDVSLKIDGEFVSAASSNPRAAAVCKAIISTANELGVGVVAEHVEVAAEVEWLLDLGCSLHQGWFYSPSVSVERLAELAVSPPANWRAPSHLDH